MNKYDKLDLTTLPLVGRTLIEASAGTGKTYSIALIYLRLLLGIGENKFLRPLDVKEILVVTFTTAATEELKDRIRKNINQLRLALLGDENYQTQFESIIPLIKNKNDAIKWLLTAEQNSDDAAIFTIHSYCQKILMTYAFESGILFNQTLSTDTNELLIQVINDYWRDNFVDLTAEKANLIRKIWQSPDELSKAIKPLLNIDKPININNTTASALTEFDQFFDDKKVVFENLKNNWLKNKDEIILQISKANINKTVLNKLSVHEMKVSTWAIDTFNDLTFPPELKQFSHSFLKSKTNKNGVTPSYPFLKEIDDFIQNNQNNLKEVNNLLIFNIVNEIKTNFSYLKQSLNVINYDDQISQLSDALKNDNDNHLANKIAKQYPAALIDEFQDTDEQQFFIFDAIYHNRKASCLMLIGDPKQAIYAFRGADVFTYLKAKNSADNRFSMDTNWRSSKDIVKAINLFFKQQTNPFIFDDIPYFSMNFAEKNEHKQLITQNNSLSAFHIHFLNNAKVNKTNYELWASSHCAETIAHFLSSKIKIKKNNIDNDYSALHSSDIAILVRTSAQAELIQRQLSKRNIKSVFLSNNKNILQSQQAAELQRILHAIAHLDDEVLLKNALATKLFGLTLNEINQLQTDSVLMEQVIDEFKYYYHIWLEYGIFVMLKKIISKRSLIKKLGNNLDGERIIINFLHLAELLQEQENETESPQALVRLFATQIENGTTNDNYEQRLESDENLIKIITIHKSKGLEFPVVFIPFMAQARSTDAKIYHDPTTKNIKFAMSDDEQINSIIDNERLAEDLRILYVALTRAVYHCQLHLAATDSFNKSAIGYLLAQDSDDKTDAKKILDAIQHLASKHKIDLLSYDNDFVAVTATNQEYISDKHIQINHFCRNIDKNWQVTSYSALTHYQNDSSSLNEFEMANIKLDDESFELSNIISNLEMNETMNDIHHLPKGAQVGTILHECFENTDFTSSNINVADVIVNKLKLDENWISPLNNWFNDVLKTKLLDDGMSLSALTFNTRINELEFYLPIKQSFNTTMLDNLCKHYDPLSKKRRTLSLSTIKGMIKGFIDMIFVWNNKYYIVDYKSNCLGVSSDSYEQTFLHNAIISNCYDLQYQLYTLALHRYLSSRIQNYQYNLHFGGVFYLFVRGMSEKSKTNGIFYTKPNEQLINELSILFT